VLRIVIIGEVALYREALAISLDRWDGLSVVGRAATWREALPIIDDRGADLVVLDLPSSMGAAPLRAIRAASAGAYVVAVCTSEEDILTWAEAGVDGLATRDQPMNELADVLRSVNRGEIPCSPRVAGTLLRRVGTLARRNGQGTTNLTVRELEILELIDQGLSNKEIARRLCIELPTVKNHVHHILGKLNAHRRGEAAAIARGDRHADGPAPVTPPASAAS
jgi:two-component system, NarL family, nitrate/nitrite response regulator NarL